MTGRSPKTPPIVRAARGRRVSVLGYDGGPLVPLHALRADARKDALELGLALRTGTLSDRLFDAHLPVSLRGHRHPASVPVAVAREAARWLVGQGARKVLDAASGIGKASVVAGAATGLRVTGLDPREDHVEIAEALAIRFGVAELVSFRCGDVSDLRVRGFDGVFAFGMALVSEEPGSLRSRLAHFAPGTHLVTWQLEAALAPGWSLVHSVVIGPRRLHLWQRVA